MLILNLFGCWRQCASSLVVGDICNVIEVRPFGFIVRGLCLVFCNVF